MNREDKDYLQKALIDQDESLRLVIGIAEKAVADTVREVDPSNVGALSFMTDMVHYTAVRNMKLVHKYAESEIEKRFLGGLVMLFAMRMPIGLYLTDSPAKDVNELMQEYRAGASPYDLRREKMLADVSDKSDVSFVRQCKAEFLANKFGREALDTLVTSTWLRAKYVFGNLIHATPQAAMPNVKVIGKSIRPDLFLWIPNRQDYMVVAECDGYAYHSDKASFDQDRKRDRRLKKEGIDVYRFSGTELFHTPLDAAEEFFDELLRLTGALSPQLSETERPSDAAAFAELTRASLEAMDYQRTYEAAEFGFVEGESPEVDSDGQHGESGK